MWVFKQEVLLFKKQKQKQNKTKRKTNPPQNRKKQTNKQTNKQTKKQCWEVRKSTHRIFCVTYIIISILIM